MLTRFEADRRPDNLSENHLWILAGLPELSAHTLDRWLDALNAMTTDQWARVASGSASADLATTSQDVQIAIVSAIERHRLEVAVWFLRDAVATTLYYATIAPLRSAQFSAREISRIHRATEWAAMAIAVETWLDPSICDALIAPFELILPSAFPQLL